MLDPPPPIRNGYATAQRHLKSYTNEIRILSKYTNNNVNMKKRLEILILQINKTIYG